MDCSNGLHRLKLVHISHWTFFLRQCWLITCKTIELTELDFFLLSDSYILARTVTGGEMCVASLEKKM